MILIILTLAKTCLKVFKFNCCRPMNHLPYESLACLEVWPLGHVGSVLVSVVTQALLCNFLCAGFYLFFLTMLMMAVSGNPGFYVLNSIQEPVAGIELPKEVFSSMAR
jgi:hypothetical protein